ncbi:hypothetical protein Tco_0763411, partial [Tanacetum coccineum]
GMIGHGDRLAGMLGRVTWISGDVKSWEIGIVRDYGFDYDLGHHSRMFEVDGLRNTCSLRILVFLYLVSCVMIGHYIAFLSFRRCRGVTDWIYVRGVPLLLAFACSRFDALVMSVIEMCELNTEYIVTIPSDTQASRSITKLQRFEFSWCSSWRVASFMKIHKEIHVVVRLQLKERIFHGVNARLVFKHFRNTVQGILASKGGKCNGSLNQGLANKTSKTSRAVNLVRTDSRKNNNAFSKSEIETQMQRQEEKVNMREAVDAGVVVTESSGTKPDKQEYK